MKKNIILKFPIFNLFYNTNYKTNNFIFLYYSYTNYNLFFIKLCYNKNLYLNTLLNSTHSKKRKSLINSSGKKPRAQKGTGLSRAGSTVSPNWRGGGVVFGPSIKKNKYKFNAKEVIKLKIILLLNKKNNIYFIRPVKKFYLYLFFKFLGIFTTKKILVCNLSTFYNNFIKSFFYLKSKDLFYPIYFVFLI